ncbi:MAG TPA: hypothetical protein VMT50_01810 [Steroidobacteraceae bacterium]|nr:hypothetical protein [Steroidobacteraceae bacterium]
MNSNERARQKVTALPLPGSPLGAGVHRELVDLNRDYLGLCLALSSRDDPRFRLPVRAETALRSGSADLIERLARCPVALLQLQLPDLEILRGDAVGESALDVRPATGMTQPFVSFCLATARHLAQAAPFLARIALGVDASVQRRLATMPTADLRVLVGWSGVIRPRWGWHEPFWAALVASAAEGRDDLAVRRALCVGLCLPHSAPAGRLRSLSAASRLRSRRARAAAARRLSC